MFAILAIFLAAISFVLGAPATDLAASNELVKRDCPAADLTYLSIIADGVPIVNLHWCSSVAAGADGSSWSNTNPSTPKTHFHFGGVEHVRDGYTMNTWTVRGATQGGITFAFTFAFFFKDRSIYFVSLWDVMYVTSVINQDQIQYKIVIDGIERLHWK